MTYTAIATALWPALRKLILRGLRALARQLARLGISVVIRGIRARCRKLRRKLRKLEAAVKRQSDTSKRRARTERQLIRVVGQAHLRRDALRWLRAKRDEITSEVAEALHGLAEREIPGAE